MFNKIISIAALVVAIAIALYFAFAVSFDTASSGNGSYDTIDLPASDTAFGGLFPVVNLNDSLPHYLYRQKEDSVKRLHKVRETVHNGDGMSGTSSGFLGVYKEDKERNYPDTTLLPKGDLHYLSLKGYKLRHDSRFFVHNGTYNLAYVVWDSVRYNNKDSIRSGHYERKQIPVRYKANDEKILIPISHTWYEVLSFLILVLPFIMIAVVIYAFVAFPIQIVWSISKGNAFTEKNIARLRFMALVATILTLISLLLPYLFHLVFLGQIPPEFSIQPFYTSVLNHLFGFIIATTLYGIAKAFQRGYSLQQDQNLTI